MYVSHTHIQTVMVLQVNSPTPIKVSRVVSSDCSMLSHLLLKRRANENYCSGQKSEAEHKERSISRESWKQETLVDLAGVKEDKKGSLRETHRSIVPQHQSGINGLVSILTLSQKGTKERRRNIVKTFKTTAGEELENLVRSRAAEALHRKHPSTCRQVEFSFVRDFFCFYVDLGINVFVSG